MHVLKGIHWNGAKLSCLTEKSHGTAKISLGKIIGCSADSLVAGRLFTD